MSTVEELKREYVEDLISRPHTAIEYRVALDDLLHKLLPNSQETEEFARKRYPAGASMYMLGKQVGIMRGASWIREKIFG